MIIQAIKTQRISPGSIDLIGLLDTVVAELPLQSVLAITSKIVSLCEDSVVPLSGIDKRTLIEREADWHLPADTPSKYGIEFTVKNDTLIPTAGIDESNAGDVYVLWPRDPQATANRVRAHLCERFGHGAFGVIITDSTCRPMRRGTSGISLAFSGFLPLKNYLGQPDLFDRAFKVSQADIAGGLAAAAVLAMGEGAESTPLALISDLEAVDFVDRDPTAEELASVRISLAEDLFAPFLGQVTWLQGGSGKIDT